MQISDPCTILQENIQESVTLADQTGTTALLAFGANLPFDGMLPAETIRAAAAALETELAAKVRLGPLFGTPCFPPGSGPDYTNACARMTLSRGLAPALLLAALHRIEARHGRTRDRRWGMRTLDIDLLAMGCLIEPDAATQDHWRDLPPDQQATATPDRLILPHPRLQDRAFVLVPLACVAPDWTHPRLGVDVATLLSRLPAADVQAVTLLD